MITQDDDAADADEWTHVQRKPQTFKGRRRRKPAPRPAPVFGQPPPIATDLTLKIVTKDFALKTQVWKDSACRRQVLDLLTRLRPPTGWTIDTAVCLASGSFSRDNWECRRRSAWQMAVFADLREFFASSSQSVTAVAQEPAYTPLDTQFLSSLQIETLSVSGSTAPGLGPAKAHCNRQTFLYEPFMDMDASVLRDLVEAEVAVYIGSSLRGRLDRTARSSRSGADGAEAQRQEEEASLAAQFVEKYDAFRFPAFEAEPNALEGLWIYVRKEAEEVDVPA